MRAWGWRWGGGMHARRTAHVGCTCRVARGLWTRQRGLTRGAQHLPGRVHVLLCEAGGAGALRAVAQGAGPSACVRARARACRGATPHVALHHGHHGLHTCFMVASKLSSSCRLRPEVDARGSCAAAFALAASAADAATLCMLSVAQLKAMDAWSGVKARKVGGQSKRWFKTNPCTHPTCRTAPRAQ